MATLKRKQAEALGVVPPKRHKYNVSPKSERTFRGVVYASKAEMQRAIELVSLQSLGFILSLQEQVTIKLGPDHKYRVDFVYENSKGCRICEDVKGKDTADFRRHVRMWKKYGQGPLRILRWKKGAWDVETIWPMGMEQK